MNVIRGAVYLQRRTMQFVYDLTKIVMQPWSKFRGDQWQSILGSIDYVIEQIRVLGRTARIKGKTEGGLLW